MDDQETKKKVRRPAYERAVDLVGSLSLDDLAAFASDLRATRPKVAEYLAEMLTA